MSSNDSMEDVSAKLNVLIALALRQLIGDKEFGKHSRGKKGTGDIARYLSDLGLGASEIAQILGVPLPSVRTLLSPYRRK